MTNAAEIDAYWQREAAKAYDERKRRVWEEYSKHGVQPWMRFQVAAHDLPFLVMPH